MEGIRSSQEQHLRRDWEVHEITEDFDLWDVWKVPIIADNSDKENFQVFYDVAVKAFLMPESKKSMTSFLFRFRHWLGKLFPLDKNVNTLQIPGCMETSVRERLSPEYLKRHKDGKSIKNKNVGAEFPSVYLSLIHISE